MEKEELKIEKDTRVVVETPEEIKIKLVQSNDLKYYELFQWLLILLLPTASSFWTSYFTVEKSPGLFWSASVFTAISLLFGILAIFQRRKLSHKSVSKYISLNSFKLVKRSQAKTKNKVKSWIINLKNSKGKIQD